MMGRSTTSPVLAACARWWQNAVTNVDRTRQHLAIDREGVTLSTSASRRTFLRLLGVSGALAIVAACGGAAPADTPAPAAKTEAKPADAKPTTAPVAAGPAAAGSALTVEFLHPWEATTAAPGP
jgi:hypothetical protein